MSRTFASRNGRSSAMENVEAELSVQFEEARELVGFMTSLVSGSFENETLLGFFADLEIRNCSGAAALKKAKDDIQKFEEKVASWRVRLQNLVEKGLTLAKEGALAGYRLKFASRRRDESPRASPSKTSSKREEKELSRKPLKARPVETSDSEEDSPRTPEADDSDYEPEDRCRKPSKALVRRPTTRSSDRMDIVEVRKFPAVLPAKKNPFPPAADLHYQTDNN